MPSPQLNAGEHSPGPASISGESNTSEDSLPDIRFREPTDEEAKQIEIHLSDDPQRTSSRLPLLTSKIGNLQHLFSYDFPPESIAESARISDPAAKWNHKPTGNSYASFGDDGTTVTVNAYGSIIQITRSLGHGRSGLFCVDTSGVCGPTSPQSRLEQLMQLSRNPESGIRLKVLNTLVKGASTERTTPKMEFVFNRWPRFTSQQLQLRGDQEETPCWSLQYFCNKGTVFQRYTFNRDPEALSALQNHLLCIQQDFSIRTLDFVNESAFNDAEVRGNRYINLSGQESHSQVAVHRMTKKEAVEIGMEQEYEKSKGPKAVGLVVTALVNGKVQALYRHASLLYISLSEEARNEVKTSKAVDITIAYRLQTFTSIQSWRQSFIPASDLAAMGATFSEEPGGSYQNIRWSSQDHIDFVTGRNLEHILSVCSIPMPKASSVPAEEDEMDTTSIALTCGDMSGHRVATSATFFAFQFLIEMLKYLCDKSKETRDYLPDPKGCHCFIGGPHKCGNCTKLDSYVHKLRARILKTLEAHLTWTAKARKLDNLDATDFWITGEKIVGLQSHRYSSSATLTDIPFEIIKSHNLYQFYKANVDRVYHIKNDDMKHMEIMNQILLEHDGQSLPPEKSVLNTRFRDCVPHWLRKLSEGDKQSRWAFSRSQDEKCKKYHLADHVWICRAVKCVEALGLEQHLRLENPSPNPKLPPNEVYENANQSDNLNSSKQKTTNWSGELQNVILKRFTTRNPQYQRRMLATSRSSSDTRFLFHARDTALFYAMDHGFFDRETKESDRRTNWTNKRDVWKETIEAQAEHEEPQALDWEKPLWFALAFIISSRRRRINKMSADDMLHATSKILFALSSSSGLFPGFLNKKREPIVFEDEIERDKYWQATFEIPYVLWMYGSAHLETSLDLEPTGVFGENSHDTTQAKTYSQISHPMKKKMEFAAFHSLIDKSRLVEISDDWMQEAPPSLNFDCPVDFTMPEHDFGAVINSALDYREDLGTLNEPEASIELKGTVVDVPRNSSARSSNQKSGQLQLNLMQGLQSNSEIREMLGTTRTAETAKKRLVWLPKADKYTALTCYLASPQMERDNLSAFFDRHASYEKHFSDGTSATLNEWTTELHLSFFRGVAWDSQDAPNNQPPQKPKKGTISEPSFILVDPQMASLRKSTRSTKIVRSVMSFRFAGDFFDRYWTCHFLENDLDKVAPEHSLKKTRAFRSSTSVFFDDSQPKETLRLRLSHLGFSGKTETEMKAATGLKQPWQQRKVLELLLFEYIVEEIFTYTEKLLNWVRESLRVDEEDISYVDGTRMVSILQMPFAVRATDPPNPLAEALQAGVQSLVDNSSDGYFSIVERWRFFEQVLQAMEEDLAGNLETIALWNSREKDRGFERPRWTKNDERTYRHVINKLQVMNQRKVRDLDGLRTDIRTFRDTLTAKLETMRSDLEYRGSENVTLFTYVTVVFFPLGFATGVFSMSDVPKYSVLVSMIQLALIAMAITLFALANSKTTGKTIVQPIILIFRFINNQLLGPVLLPFCILGNFLLLIGIVVKFLITLGFYRFLVLPLADLFGRDRESEFVSERMEFLKREYESIVEFNKRVIAERQVLNPAKVAQKLFRDHLKEKEEQSSERKNPFSV